MSKEMKHIIICSTSLAQYDRRLLRISNTLSKKYRISWISRGQSDASWLSHRVLDPIFKKGFLFYASFNFMLFFKLLFGRYDVVCSVDLDTVLPCFLVSKIRRKKLVFDAHEFFTEVPELEGREFVKSVWRSVEKFCLTRIENNYTVGPELAKIFAERHRKKYEVIRNVPFRKPKNDRRKHDGRTIVYLGMVNEGRGVELAIEALLELPDKQLKVIGSGDVEHEMKSLANELGVNDRVTFKGYVSPDKIEREMEACWIAINMLNPISKSYYYSLANKYFDYMQAGIPTVNMAFPEYKAIHEKSKTGVLVYEYTVSSLIEGVKKLQEQVYYQACISDINMAKAQYSWEIEGEKLIEFYDKLA